MNDKSAFTLTEVLISVSLLIVIAAAFSALFKSSARLEKEAELKLAAAYALQAEMEELRNLPFVKLLSQNGKAFGGGRGSVKIVQIDPDLAEVKVKLNWKPGRQEIEVFSLRSN